MTREFLRKHGTKLLVPIFMVFYMVSFFYLENRVNYRFHVIHSSFDKLVPFCEYFVVPYFLWFFYIAITVLWFMFKNKDQKEYLQLIFNLGIGMTVFILVSWIYPNGHLLRPIEFPRENIFTDMVRFLYTIDTPTNVLPSIHVYNSLGIYLAVTHNKKLRKNKLVCLLTLILTVSIILATMFIKQHSFFDVCCAFVLAAVMYHVVYRHNWARAKAAATSSKTDNNFSVE